MSEWFDAEIHVERAHEAYEAGRWAEAESALREALSLNPFKAEWHFNLGLTLEASGQFEAAARAFVDAHELEPEDPAPLNAIGVNLLRSGKPKDSIPYFEKAQSLEPADAAPLVHRIEAYARLGDHEQAELMFYLAQQVNPKDAGALANLAESLMARGLREKAVWCLREASQLDPGMPRIHARLADAFAASGRLERARQLYLRELRSDPGDIDTLLDLGCVLVDMNRLVEASEKFRRVLEIEPDNAHALFYLADLAEKQGLNDQAIDGFLLLLRLDAGFPSARRRAAAGLVRRAQPADIQSARQLLESELAELAQPAPTSEHPNCEPVPPNELVEELVALAQTMLDARMPQAARAVLARAAACIPPDARTLHLLSFAAFQDGDTQAGIRAARRAVALDRTLVPAWHNLAIAYARQQRLARALTCVLRALHVDPHDAALRRLRFRLQLSRVRAAILPRRRPRSARSSS